MGRWVPQQIRDQVVDYVKHYSGMTYENNWRLD